MIRILGNNLLNDKKIYIALTKIYGLGIATTKKILKSLNINFNLTIKSLKPLELTNLHHILEKGTLKLEGDLKRATNLNIKRLININSLRGIRHLKGLPVRGQRTRTNSRTSRKKIKL